MKKVVISSSLDDIVSAIIAPQRLLTAYLSSYMDEIKIDCKIAFKYKDQSFRSEVLQLHITNDELILSILKIAYSQLKHSMRIPALLALSFKNSLEGFLENADNFDFKNRLDDNFTIYLAIESIY